MMLMCLGLFVFSLQTAPFQELKRQSAFDWAESKRVSFEPAYQYVGRGEESLQLSGVLYPEMTGGLAQIQLLRLMAEKGEPYLLLSGTGEIHGYYFIESIQETQSALLPDGRAQKIEFSLSLKRYSGKHQTQSPLTPLFQILNRA